MAKKNKTTAHSAETQEQKEARWAKNNKMARSFAKQAGLDKKALAERKQIQKEKKTLKSR